MGEPSQSRRLFCSRPFTHLEVSTLPHRGEAFLCCPTWLPKSVGNLTHSAADEVWNGEAAREIRESILDGSFKYCTTVCPFLNTKSGFVQFADEVTHPHLRRTIDEYRVRSSTGPKVVGAAFDWSCNLSCPSCRPQKIIERDSKAEILDLQDKLAREVFRDLGLLYITGSGDAFGSPFFLDWLRRMRLEDHPALRIHLHTNAQLWTPALWEKLPEQVRDRVVSTEISIDAAAEATYLKNRKGGSWRRLLENLAFIASLRERGPLCWIKFHMVVQENNFLEMPDFIELGHEFGADEVYFSALLDWKVLDPGDFKQRAVHEPGHPRHRELLQILEHPRLQDPVVSLGNLSSLGRQVRAPEHTFAVPVPRTDPVFGPYWGN